MASTVNIRGAKRKWIAIAFTVLTAGLLTALGIYGIEEYGISLFILTPIYIGTCSTLIYGYKQELTFNDAFQVSFSALLFFALGLLVFAIEGLICIAMAFPIGLLFMTVGTFIGYHLLPHPKNTPKIILALMTLIPLTGFIEKDTEPGLCVVRTSIEIDASPIEVWKNVVAFPALDSPDDFLFKVGIAYPTSAQIKGAGAGAVRYCNFNTGTFIEPITVWDEPRVLKFDVAQQPEPLREISFWDIDAPHLHDYFVSRQGQFTLTELPGKKTLLEGTTWYHHNIKPAFYWQLWSEYIVHKIHTRVLKHIKKNSERIK
ncbi:MAG: hypothetical protein AB1458_13395 [Bacteroidota bacterium]